MVIFHSYVKLPEGNKCHHFPVPNGHVPIVPLQYVVFPGEPADARALQKIFGHAGPGGNLGCGHGECEIYSNLPFII